MGDPAGGPSAARADAGGTPRWLLVLSLLFAALLAGIVASSLARPEPPAFAPTEPAARAAGPTAAGGGSPAVVRDTYTVDARGREEWVFFDFSLPGVVPGPDPAGWDLAFRRFDILVNGGEGFAGAGGARDLGDVPLDSLAGAARTGPASGGPPGEYRPSEGRLGGEPRHSVLADWYRYGFFTHLLTPRPRTYDIRTAEGGRAAIRILSYYCPGAEPGCLTFDFLHPLAPRP